MRVCLKHICSWILVSGSFILLTPTVDASSADESEQLQNSSQASSQGSCKGSSENSSRTSSQGPSQKSAQSGRNPYYSSTPAAVTVEPGPYADERKSLFLRIQAASDRGIGTQSYKWAFLDLEGLVRRSSPESEIKRKLDSLDAALNKQLSSQPLQATRSSMAHLDTGILGMKFLIDKNQFPKVTTVFPDGPASVAQLQDLDVITQVNGTSTKNLGAETVYKMLVGRPTTKVTLTIMRGDTIVIKKTLTRLRAADFAKMQPDIWKMYQSKM